MLFVSELLKEAAISKKVNSILAQASSADSVLVLTGAWNMAFGFGIPTKVCAEDNSRASELLLLNSHQVDDCQRLHK